MKKRFLIGILFLVVAVFALVVSAPAGRTASAKKVIVLGFDGMDPILAERWMADGSLPNLKRLREMGDYRTLQTSCPPQSPVAWSNFITGMNPGGHGIFDFIHRDPNTYMPEFSMSKSEEAGKTVKLGKWIVPLSGGKVTLERKGRAFWEYLEDKGVPCTVFMIPSNFPPVPVKSRQISGMGTPDIQGTYGMFSFYTSLPPKLDETVSGGRIFPVQIVDGTFTSAVPGPKNTFIEKAPRTDAPFTVYIDAREPVAKIAIGDTRVILKEGEWSDWVQVKFEIIPHVKSITGITRFFLKQVRPDFKLYAGPVNIDPSNPALPICTPSGYSREIYDQMGFFYTQGMAEDTKALDQGIFSDDDFSTQAGFVLDERMKHWKRELDGFQEGFLFFYFSSVDLGSHMFWRTMDANHPSHPSHEEPNPQANALRELYQALDRALGMALERLDDQTLLIVMSDHGFGPYYRFFHLNTWLLENGYLTLYDRERQEEEILLHNVDWSRTKLYSLGFNGIYVNQVGRERQGIVMPGPEKEKLIEEVSAKLMEVADPRDGQKIMGHMYRTDKVYSGDYVKNAPDLIVGYHRGYRVSWESSLGQFPKELFGDNRKKWSGDHLADPAELPGVLFVNRKIRADAPALYDLPVTILGEYGIAKPSDMVGKSIFE